MQEVTAILRHAYERGKNVSRSHKCGCRHVLSLDNRSYGKIEWGEGKKKGREKVFCMYALSLSLSLSHRDQARQQTAGDEQHAAVPQGLPAPGFAQ